MKLIHPLWTHEPEACVLINNTPVFVKFDIEYDNDCVPSKVNILEFTETKQPLDEQRMDRPNYVRWGGYPDFKQCMVVPTSDDGREYKFLCTVYNHWGDMGNCNIFLLLKNDKLGMCVEDVYLEASCS